MNDFGSGEIQELIIRHRAEQPDPPPIEIRADIH
jgi:hypothetical protein